VNHYSLSIKHNFYLINLPFYLLDSKHAVPCSSLLTLFFKLYFTHKVYLVTDSYGGFPENVREQDL
jgi:hypothetical protein